MPIPSTAIINFSSRSDQDVLVAIRAVNRQIQEDFMPLWGQGRELRLHAAGFEPSDDPEKMGQEKVSADSVLYLVNESTLPGALGYHSINTAEMPVGFVFAQDTDWTITLSHEALELIVDPNTNAFIPGPHPEHPADDDKWVLHTYEACDAVERKSYRIDGILVSDFVTPQYFQPGDPLGTRNDFLGVGVRSFGVTRGSHVAFIDPTTWEFKTVFGRESPPSSRLAARAQQADHEKPARPSEETLARILASVKGSVARPKAAALAPLRGITRTGRYRAAAQLLRSRQERQVLVGKAVATASPDVLVKGQDAMQLVHEMGEQIRRFEAGGMSH